MGDITYVLFPDRTSEDFAGCEETLGSFGVAGSCCCDDTSSVVSTCWELNEDVKFLGCVWAHYQHPFTNLWWEDECCVFHRVPLWYPSCRRTWFLTVLITAGMGLCVSSLTFNVSSSLKPSGFLAKLHVTSGIISFAVKTVGRHRSELLVVSWTWLRQEQITMF